MRFLHTGDIHIGVCPEGGMPWANERAQAIRDSLLRIVNLANAEKVELLLIAGDLFDRRPLVRELKEVAYVFSKFNGNHIVLIAGNHDHLDIKSTYQNYDLGDKVSFLTSEILESVEFEELNTVVHGLSFHSREVKEPLLSGVTAPEDGKYHILLAHGGAMPYLPFSLKELSGAGFNYVALGHIHKPQIFKGTNMAYCGSPEPLDKTDLGPRGCILGDITERGTSLMWRPLAKTIYREVQITSTTEMTQAELEDAVMGACKQYPADLLIINIVGERDGELEINTESILRLGRICAVNNLTHPHYDLKALKAAHTNDLIYHYIVEFEGCDDPVSQKALYYGLRALLENQGEVL